MAKRTPDSVTEIDCTCGYLERAARDPDFTGIHFDPETREFEFVHNTLHCRIWHCPYCGGATPESIKKIEYAYITEAEEARLYGLFRPLKTIDEVIKGLGPACRDNPDGLRSRSPDGVIEHMRTLIYTKLSDTAIAYLRVYPQGRYQLLLEPRPLI